MKVNQNFPHEMYRFLHKPLRVEDKINGKLFLERYVFAFQRQFESVIDRIDKLPQLYDPALTPQPRFLKDIVGLTSELDKITNDISEQDLRKLISLAVALWKEKGLEVGYKDIIRLFTGKNSRVYNWFDFRYIVGEQGLSQEELGEDSWLISQIGVNGNAFQPNVVLLLPFEGDTKDRSIKPMDAILHGDGAFYDNGPVLGSKKYLRLFNEGFVSVPNTSKIDFNGSFTIEMFLATSDSRDVSVFSKIDQITGAGVFIDYDTINNQLRFQITDDDSNVFSGSLDCPTPMNDGAFKHIALVVNRELDTARIYFEGQDSATANIAGLGTILARRDVYIGVQLPGDQTFNGSIDNLRISKIAQYDVSSGTIPVPSVAFIPHQEEQLDEFFSDIRVVDEGDLNRTLVLRILNLMRPISERLRVIYIRYFEDFTFGKGSLVTASPGAFIDMVQTELVLPPMAQELCDSQGSEDFQDYCVQVRGKIQSGSSMGVRFLVQDQDNYYGLVMRSDTQQFELFKVVGGVLSSLGSPVSAPIFNETYYVLSVIVDLNKITNETLIQCYQDRNKIFEVVDSDLLKGTWGIQSGVGSTTRFSEIEMFLNPLSYDLILPNQVI